MANTAQAIPNTPSLTVSKITLAAEKVFARHGFDGTGMKAIATEADVSQALLHYHFGTKDRLYTAVISHRSKQINDERHALLDDIDTTADDAVRRILDALFRPPLGPAGGAEPYARIFASLVVGREQDQALVRECYDPTAQRFIQMLEETIDGADQAMAAMGYALALGSLIAVIGRNGRLERLMGRSESSGLLDTEEILIEIIEFAEGGILSLAKRAR